MGIFDRFRRLVPAQAPNGQPVYYRHFADSDSVLDLDAEELWRTQPYLRTVVTFLARNIAQLGLHAFERVSDTDRRRVLDDPLARVLSRPNPRQTTYELVYALVADLALYDEAFWWVGVDADSDSGWTIQPLPPSWVVARGGGSLFDVEWYDVQPAAARKPLRVPAKEILTFRGWNPGDLHAGSSPVVALKQILHEQMHAQSYRQQVWKRGGRVGSVLTRPAGVTWSDDARARFMAAWRAAWTGDDGTQAGGTPILEDGMSLSQVRFSAHEEQFVEAAKLSLSMVASAYHINPTMVGVLENANYSNVREFRRMLYGDTLGPTMAMIEDRLNTFLAPRVTPNGSVYVEFNIDEKLQGSFEEQTQALQSSVGRPWMSANEARALRNMPAVPGGDDLVVPLNVLVGGQASPRDSGSQNVASAPSGGVLVKARADETVVAKAQEVLERFFARQGRVLASLAGGTGLAWDEDRWNRELSDDLYRVNRLISTQAGQEALRRMGLDPDAWDEDRTAAWLRANADGVASGINGTTRVEVESAVDGAEDPSAAVVDLFAGVVVARAGQIAASQVSALSGFGTTEAARQSGRRASKVWRVTSGNPRASHSAMDGERVPVGELFSNGARWPGDSVLPADERAGCTCEIDIEMED